MRTRKCPECGVKAKRLYGVEVMRVMCLRCMMQEVGL